MFKNLKESIEVISIMPVSEERKEILRPLAEFIQKKGDAGESINLNFICTHNSRRSHLSQIWAQVMAEHFNIQNVYCYSGGTEATAMFPKVAETLQSQGMEIQKLCDTENPVYAVKYAENAHPVICFSKKYDDAFNPVSGFAAVMTCSNADAGCPFIAGAEKRVAVKFEDPKSSDGTHEMDRTYYERSLEIAAEMYYVMSLIR
ncbi:low molecular weight phosphatase family protein [Chryseobacterium sp. HSC-36S06]|uniref:arsenate-mycothiol transferase ArsC n=1 Tax=Chryseobacterium sp. HSC-36S06 TaxID=2910970 RepID=UPI0020A0BF73|nr:protein-tyrosine-phosphatase [Chryseobacterium sp. HSC-36S06]MCP2038353.1 arsenate reductase [Chryseobacterium sp. HSC-36S06]